jgi:hypothetical protein
MSVSERTPRRSTWAPEELHPDIGERSDGGLDEADTLFQRKHRLLVGVDAHADDQPVEDACRPADDVEMAECDRVERAGVDGGAGCVWHGVIRWSRGRP